MKADKPTVLLTLGRLPVALELARAMHSGGWRVLVAEPFAWHLCRLSNTVDKSFKVSAPTVDKGRYLAQLRHIIESEHVSLVLPVSEEILYVAELKDQLPESVRLVCGTQGVLLSLHDKHQFMQLAQAHRLPVPKTVLAEDSQACAELMKKPYVIKPRLSCSGAGVRFGTGEHGDDRLNPTVMNDGYIVQERLFGEACCSFSITAAGAVLTSVCYRSLLESGSVSVCFEQMDVPEDIARFIATVAMATECSGMIAFDFIQDDEGDWRAIECNPRATSGLHFLDQQDMLTMLIEPAGLADRVGAPARRHTERRQEFWSCLMQVEGALFKGSINRAGWRNLFRIKDITWRFADMKPFMLMSIVLAPQLFRSFRSGRPVSELLMSDLGWHETRQGGDR